MLTPSILQQTTRFFSDLLESPMTDDWLEKNFGFAMVSDYATVPPEASDDAPNKQLLDASSDPQLPCFPSSSFTVDELYAKLGDDEDDDDDDDDDEMGYEEEMEADEEELEEFVEETMLEWNRQQQYLPVDVISANETEINRIPGIDKNPWSWTVSDASAWCDWALRQFRVTDSQRSHLLKNLHRSGNELCQFSFSDFQDQFGASGKYMYAELELWKNVHVIASAESEQKQSDAKVDRDETNVALHHPMSCRIPPDHRVLTETASSNVTNHHHLSSLSIGLKSTITSTVPGFSGQLPSDNLASTSQPSASQGNIFSDLRIPTFVVDSAPDTPPSCENEAAFARGPPLFSEYVSAAAAAAGADAEADLWRCYNSPRLPYDADSGVSLDSDCTSSYDATQKISPGESPDELWQPHAKQGNHLWQFLHELLSQPSLYVDCIRWIDRKQGIFKIVDSVHVARLWGDRKNRPAMNYDKLSRSIRQYYKKGIIRKTNHSKRLVYQFCPRYV